MRNRFSAGTTEAQSGIVGSVFITNYSAQLKIFWKRP
jgi:hypothetical protein